MVTAIIIGIIFFLFTIVSHLVSIDISNEKIREEAKKNRKNTHKLTSYLIETQIAPKSITSEDRIDNAIRLLRYRPEPLGNGYEIGSMPLSEYFEKLHYPTNDLEAENNFANRHQLEGIDFLGKELANLNANKVIFRNCSFESAKMAINFNDAFFTPNTSFKKSQIFFTDFGTAYLNDADFSDVQIVDAISFMGASLEKVNFNGICLEYRRVSWKIEKLRKESNKEKKDFSESEIYKEAIQLLLQDYRKGYGDKGYWGTNYHRFARHEFHPTSFAKALVNHTDFTNAYLIEANFCQATGKETCFNQSMIMQNIFLKADLSEPSFKDANIEHSIFNQATLHNADFSNAFCSQSSFENIIHRELHIYIKRIRYYDKPKPVAQWQKLKSFLTFTYYQRHSFSEFVKALAEKRTQLINFFTPKIHKTIITYANFNDSVFERCRFKYVNLEGSTFHNAKMEKCSFWFCNFRGCDLTNAKFIDCKGLSVRQLSKAKTLKDAQLPDKLRLPLQKRFPHLFV